jgi:hypothetical protein
MVNSKIFWFKIAHFIKQTASASPITNCAVVLFVGAKLLGQASESTVVFKTKSAPCQKRTCISCVLLYFQIVLKVVPEL